MLGPVAGTFMRSCKMGHLEKHTLDDLHTIKDLDENNTYSKKVCDKQVIYHIYIINHIQLYTIITYFHLFSHVISWMS